MLEVTSISNSRNGNCREAIKQVVEKTIKDQFKTFAKSIDNTHTASSS